MQSTTPIVAIPLVDASSPSQYATTDANIGASTVVTLNFGRPFIRLGLVRFKLKRIAGSAANFTPFIFSKAGVTTAGNISQEYEGSATAVANLFDPQLADAPVVMQTDENGRLYLVPGPDAGADNQFEYALRFIVYAYG